jgi:lysophospholipase L1-like esterase
MMFTVGAAATSITALWTHWYTNNASNPVVDTDPAGPISFNASLKVVSSTNPGTVTGQLYRLTFNGRTTATLDPGGRITADPLGLSLAPGDVVAVRTFLISGTAYTTRNTQGATNAGWGGFTSTTDLTAPGSAAISSSTGQYYGAAALLGRPQGAGTAKSVLLVGDSIGWGKGDDAYYTIPALGGGNQGFFMRALTGQAGTLSLAVGSDEAVNFQSTNGSFRRLSLAPLCNSAIIQAGTNDVALGATAAATEAVNLDIATKLQRLGIGKVFVTTLVPRTTSTDGWATTANQTPISTESQRLAYNAWVRASCPIDPTTKAPVAVGTSNALLAGQFGHPFTGFFDTAAQVESSLNSGLWLPANRIVTGSITTGTGALTSSTANFLTANQEAGGDKGRAFSLVGAGAAGAILIAQLAVISSSTAATIDTTAGTTVTNAVLAIGIATKDGIHPSPHSHYLMSQAINPAVL